MDNRNQHLHTLLAELHAELERTPAVDVEAREHIELLMQDMRDLLHRSEEAQIASDQGLDTRLSDAIGQFEASHPQLTAIITQVLDTLRRTF